MHARVAAFMVLVVAGCGGGGGTGGTLVRIDDEPPGANCADGGVAISTGVDDDDDGMLDDAEIDSTSYVCDGDDDPQVIVSTMPEPPGANCADGGVAISTGIDDDGDGVLDPEEVDETTYVCDGENGTSVLVSTAVEPPGANCAGGGTVVHSGIDDDDDGVLDAAEIDATTYVCNGSDGVSVLVATAAEPPGANCAGGGTAVHTGIDDDDDGVLDAAEIDATTYVCDGVDGGVTDVLVDTVAEPPGPNCTDGGTLVLIGGDLDDDGILDAPEVTSTVYMCDGLEGPSVLVSTTVEPGGINCALGGIAIHTGIDDDGDDTLDAAEIDSTSYVCHGPDGAMLGPVLDGSYDAQNNIDLALLAGVEHITGHLTIFGVENVSLPNLVQVDGYMTVGAARLDADSFPSLTTVGTDFSVSVGPTEAAVLPSLELVGSSFYFNGGRELHLGATVIQTVISIRSTAFRRFFAPSLTALSGLSVELGSATPPSPVEFEVPVLEGLFGLFVKNNSAALDLSGLSGVTEFSTIEIWNNSGLTEISGWTAPTIGLTSIRDNPNLVSIDMPNVTTSGHLDIHNNPRLGSLSMPLLTSAGDLVGLYNPQLPRCHVTDIVAQLTANGWTGVSSLDDTLPACVTIDWCRLQFPTALVTTAGAAVTYYGRFYTAGLTDLSVLNNGNGAVRAQIGFGPDASDPATSPLWTWTSGAMNPAWNGTTAGEPNNDEWQTTITAPTPGTYDTAYRFSGDGGRNWRYCDINAGAGSDGSQDGYQVANAGSLTTN